MRRVIFGLLLLASVALAGDFPGPGQRARNGSQAQHAQAVVNGLMSRGLTLHGDAFNSHFAPTTTGLINLDDTVDLRPSLNSVTIATGTTRLMKFDKNLTLNGGTFTPMDIAPTLSIGSGTEVVKAFRVGGTWTATTAPILYVQEAFSSNITYDTSTAAAPFLPDTFDDSSTIQNTGGAASDSTYTAVSFLSSQNIKATGGNYTNSTTVGTAGLWAQLQLNATVGNVLSITRRAGVTVKDPTTSGAGTVTLTNNDGIYLWDLTKGTTNNGIESAITAGANKYFLNDTGGAQSSFVGNITKINNVTTSFPATQGAAGSYLQNNGSGTLTWAVPNPIAYVAYAGGAGL